MRLHSKDSYKTPTMYPTQSPGVIEMSTFGYLCQNIDNAFYSASYILWPKLPEILSHCTWEQRILVFLTTLKHGCTSLFPVHWVVTNHSLLHNAPKISFLIWNKGQTPSKDLENIPFLLALGFSEFLSHCFPASLWFQHKASALFYTYHGPICFRNPAKDLPSDK